MCLWQRWVSKRNAYVILCSHFLHTDLLSVTSLVHYFGKQEEVDKIRIAPIVCRKGTTQVALYGLGHLREERLHRSWYKAKFSKAPDCFSIFCVHQNRDVGRGTSNCLKESMIPDWMDVVVWGHEHECLMDLQESIVGTFRITQPGSSVATSLVPGEAARKQVGLLDVRGDQFRLTSVPLVHVRTFVCTQLSLSEHRAQLDPADAHIDAQVTEVLAEEVRYLQKQATEKRVALLRDAAAVGHPLKDQTFSLAHTDQALIRIKVEHSGFTTLNNQRFGAAFVGQVANPEDMLLFHRRKTPGAPRASSKKMPAVAPEELLRTDMDDLVANFLQAPESQLQVLSRKKLGEALEEFVDKNVVSSVDDAADAMLQQKQRALLRRVGKEADDEREEEDGDGKENGTRREVDEDDEVEPTPKSTRKTKKRKTDDSDDEDNVIPDPKPPRRAPGTRLAPGDAKRQAARRQKLAISMIDSSEEEDAIVIDSDEEVDDNDVEEVIPKPTTKRRGRASKAATEEEEPKKRGRASANKTSKKSAATKKKSTTKKRAIYSDSSEDEGAYGANSIDMDGDWGSAITKSQR